MKTYHHHAAIYLVVVNVSFFYAKGWICFEIGVYSNWILMFCPMNVCANEVVNDYYLQWILNCFSFSFVNSNCRLMMILIAMNLYPSYWWMMMMMLKTANESWNVCYAVYCFYSSLLNCFHLLSPTAHILINQRHRHPHHRPLHHYHRYRPSDYHLSYLLFLRLSVFPPNIQRLLMSYRLSSFYAAQTHRIHHLNPDALCTRQHRDHYSRHHILNCGKR